MSPYEFVASIETWPQAIVASALILGVSAAFCAFFWAMTR